MKRTLTVLFVVLSLMMAFMLIPTAFAEGESFENYVAVKEVKTAIDTIDITSSNKVIDVFVGESISVSSDICIYKNQIIVNPTEDLALSYHVDNDIFDMKKSDEIMPESGLAYLKRETITLTPKKACQGEQLIIEYMDGDTPLFDSITINALEKKVNSIALAPNVTTLKTNQVVDFDVVINGSDTLGISDTLSYTINGTPLLSLDGYRTPAKAGELNVSITMTDKNAVSKTFDTKLAVKDAAPLTSIVASRDSYGFLLKSGTGKIALYTTKGAYPNIQLTSKSKCVALDNVALVTSDKEGLDKYELTLTLLAPAMNESVLITADKEYYLVKVSIIDAITSVAISPEDTKFESGKTSRFHIVVNGVKDVETDVVWTINGTEQSSHSNILEYKSISASDVKISANVGEIIGEYNYTISTDKGSIILTVVLSIVVIIICIPILIALKKHSKPDLKAMVKKDNKNAIKELDALKELYNSDEKKDVLKKILKVNAVILRAEKRAQQESFECENKAFNTALAQLSEAKSLMSDLMQTQKTNPRDVNINLIDNVIFALESANNTIDKVKDNE